MLHSITNYSSLRNGRAVTGEVDLCLPFLKKMTDTNCTPPNREMIRTPGTSATEARWKNETYLGRYFSSFGCMRSRRKESVDVCLPGWKLFFLTNILIAPKKTTIRAIFCTFSARFLQPTDLNRICKQHPQDVHLHSTPNPLWPSYMTA